MVVSELKAPTRNVKLTFLSIPYSAKKKRGSFFFIQDIASELKGAFLRTRVLQTFSLARFARRNRTSSLTINLIVCASGQRIIQRLRKNVFQSVINADVSFFDQSKTGELLNRLSNDTDVVGSSLTYNVSDGLRSTLQILGGLSLMASQVFCLDIAVYQGLAISYFPSLNSN